MTYVSIHGNRLGLSGDGFLRVDGKDFKGAIPTLGKDLFVDSVTGADTSDGLTPDRALATLDKSFELCTANKGYQVFCLPLHAETITATGGIAHDVAGVSVFGLGHGGQRPTFLMDGASSPTYLVTGDDARVENLKFNSGHDGIATCVQVTSATDAWFNGLEFGDNTTAEHFLTCIKAGSTNNTCDGLKITNCVWSSIDTGSLEFIETTDDVDRIHIADNFVSTLGTASPLTANATGDLYTDAFYVRNFIVNKNTSGNLLHDGDGTANTGIMAHNRVGHLDTVSGVLAIATSGFLMFDNLGTSDLAASGVVNPAADTV